VLGAAGTLGEALDEPPGEALDAPPGEASGEAA